MSTTAFAATGKRKQAVARIRLVPGEPKVLINNRSVEDYFPRGTWVKQVMQPLEAANAKDKYTVLANVYGGGLSGQAGAISHGIARALVISDEALKKPLRAQGLLTRDSRVKERKKYGQKGARRRFQYSKR